MECSSSALANHELDWLEVSLFVWAIKCLGVWAQAFHSEALIQEGDSPLIQQYVESGILYQGNDEQRMPMFCSALTALVVCALSQFGLKVFWVSGLRPYIWRLQSRRSLISAC